MSEEEKVIQCFKLIKEGLENNGQDFWSFNVLNPKEIEILLNLINKQQKEIKHKNNIMQLMANKLYHGTFDYTNDILLEKCINCSSGNQDNECTCHEECIIEYFEEKLNDKL